MRKESKMLITFNLSIVIESADVDSAIQRISELKSVFLTYKDVNEVTIEPLKPSSKPENVKCPDCGSEMKSRTGKYGTFWGCVNYPKCTGTRDSEGRSREEREAERINKAAVEQQEFYKFNKT